MHLLYLTFGENINNHVEAHFSIYTFLAQRNDINTINVITDRPEFYNDLKGYINIITVDEKILNEWKGEYNFFWRIKIKAIEMLCDLYKSEPVIYLDADTFLFSDIKFLKESFLQGAALMHEDEGNLSAIKAKTAKKMWSQTKGKIYSGITILPSHKMWNAGVVATPNQKNNSECKLALTICDEMCKQKVTPRLIEQFALSVALSETYGLQPADKTIAHYWSNKENWDKLIQQFFNSVYFRKLTVEEICNEIKMIPFDKLPVKIKIKNTNTSLKLLIEKIYPPVNLSFINKHLHQE